MTATGTIEDLIRLVQTGSNRGWEFLDRLDPQIRARIEPELGRIEADRQTVAQAWARFADSPDGALAIQALLDTTLFRTVWFVDLGTDAAAMTAFGTFREGQNALAHAIVRQIAAGRNAEAHPKPRDNPDANLTVPGSAAPAVRRAKRGRRR